MISYPSPGPRNIIRINKNDTSPRSRGRNVSLIVAGATASTGPQHRPARNRKPHRAPKVGVKAAPRVNSPPRGRQAMYTGNLPIVSETGPPMTGPNPIARMYTDVVRMEIVRETLNSSMISKILGLRIDDETQLRKLLVLNSYTSRFEGSTLEESKSTT